MSDSTARNEFQEAVPFDAREKLGFAGRFVSFGAMLAFLGWFIGRLTIVPRGSEIDGFSEFIPQAGFLLVPLGGQLLALGILILIDSKVESYRRKRVSALYSESITEANIDDE